MKHYRRFRVAIEVAHIILHAIAVAAFVYFVWNWVAVAVPIFD